MDKEKLAELIDAYADAKASKNRILVESMIEKLEVALNSIFGAQRTNLPQGVDITEEA
jgi:hypothetical protein